MEDNETVICANNLSKTFKDFWGRTKAKAVNNISFEVKKGEIIGFLGPNGSGKSTTIKMILNLLYPTSGELKVFGKSPKDVDIKRKIGYLPEETYLYKFLTAEETLKFFGHFFKLSTKEIKARSNELLEMLGMTHVRKRQVGEFSKGMARRIGIGQSLINNPELLILDEPTSGLDPVGCSEIKELITLLKKKGKTIFVSSHLLSDIEDMCDRIIILYGGRIVAEGKLGDLLKISEKNIITTPRLDPSQHKLLSDFLSGDLKIGNFDINSPKMSLENYFVNVMKNAKELNSDTAGAKHGSTVADYLKK